MKLLDLFAGIGGFSLAAHWMGWETVAFVEWDKYCQKVLQKNFPNTSIHGDIRDFDGTKYRGTIDIVCGGFPCQPFSSAGKRKGEADDRYLWPEMLRVIQEVRPTWVIGESVAGILSMEQPVRYSYLESEVVAVQETEMVIEGIRRSLKGIGYSVEFFNIPASATGVPHERQRVWIVANDNKVPGQRMGVSGTNDKQQWNEEIRGENRYSLVLDLGEVAPSKWKSERFGISTQPCLVRAPYGVSAGLDRVVRLGNAIVPQVAYEIFKAMTR